MKLFMLLIGCSPAGRHTEQHDVFFGIGNSIRDVLPDAMAFWPEAKASFHLDAWREVTLVNGYAVQVLEEEPKDSAAQLFFINLGGYKKDEFEEFHYKLIVAAADKGEAIKQAKQTAFFRHTGFKGANSHVDDKFGIDVDDCFAIADILSPNIKQHYRLMLMPAAKDSPEDTIYLGYFKPDKIDKWAPNETGT